MRVEDLFNKNEIDSFLYAKNNRAHKIFGAQFCQLNGVEGCRFALWAPRAKEVHIKGDWNNWQSPGYKMTPLWDSGIYAAFIPQVSNFDHYKYYIKAQDESILEKADPYAFYAQQPPDNASKVVSLDYNWNDSEYMSKRKKAGFVSRPMNVYEVHLGSWRRKPDGTTYSYSQLVDPLLDYVTEMGYTHIEIMPITEYPLPDSWGYQVTGYYAPTSRYGTPQDFMYFVDRCHQRNIPVILDWVPAHFPKDAFALAKFDGQPLYEYEDTRVGEHQHWGTLVFDYGKKEVVNFLISSALYWAELYHLDGFRVDAVTSMIYLDYMRTNWRRNKYGGRENLEALDFLRRLNKTMNQLHPEVLMIAEEATDWQGVTKPVEQGGLGFDLKWNMGWMNDTLRYMQREAVHRQYHHEEITFSLMYAFSENFILPLSHDEVVHSEFSMIGKMSGDYWQKFASLRTLYSYMYTHPGKKLMFMGNEFAQFIEWKFYDQLEWFMLEYDKHQQMQNFSKDLNHFYLENSPLWENDSNWQGFQWLNADDANHSTLSYVRYDKDKKNSLVVFCNFTPKTIEDYRSGFPYYGRYQVVLNSDDKKYGGSGSLTETIFTTESVPWDKQQQSFSFRLPGLSCVVFKCIEKFDANKS